MTGEARARIKINELLKRAGWRFFAGDNGPANIVLEAKREEKIGKVWGED